MCGSRSKVIFLTCLGLLPSQASAKVLLFGPSRNPSCNSVRLVSEFDELNILQPGLNGWLGHGRTNATPESVYNWIYEIYATDRHNVVPREYLETIKEQDRDMPVNAAIILALEGNQSNHFAGALRVVRSSGDLGAYAFSEKGKGESYEPLFPSFATSKTGRTL